jgi:hypothetical protein
VRVRAARSFPRYGPLPTTHPFARAGRNRNDSGRAGDVLRPGLVRQRPLQCRNMLARTYDPSLSPTRANTGNGAGAAAVGDRSSTSCASIRSARGRLRLPHSAPVAALRGEIKGAHGRLALGFAAGRGHGRKDRLLRRMGGGARGRVSVPARRTLALSKATCSTPYGPVSRRRLIKVGRLRMLPLLRNADGSADRTMRAEKRQPRV